MSHHGGQQLRPGERLVLGWEVLLAESLAEDSGNGKAYRGVLRQKPASGKRAVKVYWRCLHAHETPTRAMTCAYFENEGEMNEMKADDGWRKSNHSVPQGNCVECVAAWRVSSSSFSNGNCVACATGVTSSHSHANGQCVTAAAGDRVLWVRDSKLACESPVLAFSQQAWRDFTRRLKDAV